MTNIVYRKIYIAFIVLFAIMIGGNGCSLKEELYGLPSTEGFIEKEDDIPFVVNGVYEAYQRYDLYKSCAHSMIMYGSDEFCATRVGTGFSAGLFLIHGFTSSDTYLRSTWNYFYAAINRANSAMEVLQNASGISEETRKRVVAEMYFVRGFTYFNMVRLYGGVPIRTEPTGPNSNFYAARNSVEEVYELVFEDLKKAAAECIPFSKQPDSEFGRATQGAAQAMLALAYLTYGNYCDFNGKSSEAQTYYELAVSSANDVINSNEYSLISNYADLFDVEKEKSAYKEVIYGIQFTRDNLTSGAASRGSELAYYTQPTTRLGVTGNPPYGKGGAAIRIQPWFYDMYSSGDYVSGSVLDYRTEVSFLTKWSGTDGNNNSRQYVTYPEIVPTVTGLVREQMPYLDKYKDQGLDNRNHENDLFIIRLSEVYLIKAEALNELGRTTEAYEPFNKLRERARKANGTARTVPADLKGGLSKEEFRMAVYDERGLELVGEGHRWFDAVRTRYMNTNKTMFQWRFDTYYKEMPATKRVLPAWNNTKKIWEGGRVQPITVPEWNDRYLLYPIPASEIAANPNIGSQNSGW